MTFGRRLLRLEAKAGADACQECHWVRELLLTIGRGGVASEGPQVCDDAGRAIAVMDASPRPLSLREVLDGLSDKQAASRLLDAGIVWHQRRLGISDEDMP